MIEGSIRSRTNTQYIAAIALLILFTGSLNHAQAQNKVDSLSAILKTDKEDTNKVNHLNALGKALMYNDPDTGLVISQQAQTLSEKLQWKKGVAGSLTNAGICHWLLSEYAPALNFYFSALKIDEELGNKQAIASHYGNIGGAYDALADFPKALDYCFKALKLNEEFARSTNTATAKEGKYRVAANLSNIGVIYTEQSNYPKGIDYFSRALKINEEIGNKNFEAVNLGNLGLVYDEMADYPKALDYYNKALKMAEGLGNKSAVAGHLSNIGGVYARQATLQNTAQAQHDKLIEQALACYARALKIAEETGHKNITAITLGSIGVLYSTNKQYALAEKYLLEALKMDKEIGAQKDEGMVEKDLSEIYTKTNRFQLALEHYKNAATLKDSIFSEESRQQLLRKEMNFEFDKKEAVAQAEYKMQLEGQAAIAEEKDRKNKIVLGFVLGGLVLVLIFAVFIFRSLRITRKQKAVIEEQRNEVQEQKDLVELKQKEILDSIHYARRIQQSLLPTEKYIARRLEKLN